MNISKKILRAINEGVLNALSFDDELPDTLEVTIHKVSNNVISNELDKELKKKYYSLKLQEMLPDPNDIATLIYEKPIEQILKLKAFIYLALEWHEKYGATYNPIIDKDDHNFRFGLFARNSYLLSGAKTKTNLNWIDTSDVTDMTNTFQYLGFNGDISEWDVSNVTDMYQMFEGSKFDNNSICNWDVSNVKDMRKMFADTHMQLDLSHWQISNDCRTDHMFSDSDMLNIPEYLPKLSINEGVYNALSFDDDELPDTLEVKMHRISNDNAINHLSKELDKLLYSQKLQGMLSLPIEITKDFIELAIEWHEKYGATYNPHLDGPQFKSFIIGCLNRAGGNIDLNWIDTSDVTDMSLLFFGNTDFNGNITEWDVSNVTNMRDMFSYCKQFNLDISKWDISNVKNMCGMFYYALSFNLDLSNWCINHANYEVMFPGSAMENNQKFWPHL